MEQLTISRAAERPGSNAAASGAQTEKPSKLRVTLTRVAWLSILFGIVIEVLLIAARVGMVQAEAAVAELAGRITWSFVVCMGLAIGDALTEDKPLWLGLSGLAGAPLAFTVARGVHKGAAEFLGANSPVDAITPLLAATIRGIEYMCLGLALFWLSRKLKASIKSYIGTGLAIGLVFGTIILLVNPAITSSMTAFLSWGVNELIFPVGCSVVIFASQALSGKLIKQQ